MNAAVNVHDRLEHECSKKYFTVGVYLYVYDGGGTCCNIIIVPITVSFHVLSKHPSRKEKTKSDRLLGYNNL